MLSLEKLFYQHQYQPLELSTYLSDYIGEAKSSIKQEECTKRLYQLFIRFFNKFSTFQDSSLSHLILSISFSILTYLCENSHGSFSNFFQFGLSTFLTEQIPVKQLTENENSFTKFLSMIHLLCDTHKKTELEPLCHFIVPLLDTLLRDHIKIQTRILSSSLVNKLTDNISPSTVFQLKSSKAFSSVIVSIGKNIGDMGDIFLQSDVIESIFRLTSRTERVRLAGILFTSPQIASAFKEISEEYFEKESRNFLNTLNTSLSSQRKVFSYPCTKAELDGTSITRPTELEFLWADFNSASQTLTMFISNPCNASTPEWVTAYFRKENFTQLTLSSSKQGYHLNAKLSVSKQEICDVFPITTTPLLLQLSFSHEYNPTLGLTAALGYTGTIVNISVSSDRCDRQTLIRASMSIQAIHLITNESGLINSQVTNTMQLPGRQQHDVVSPIKPSSQDPHKCHVPLTHPTTPVTPIPSVDPKTSTPIRRASLTPNFTPNNIHLIKDQSESVLALSDKIYQSQRVQNKCEKPQIRPSSLTTHVTIPVDQTTGNNREKASRLEIITQELQRSEEITSSITKQTMDTSVHKISENTDNVDHIEEICIDTPQSVRVSNLKKTFHEESHLLKRRAKSRRICGHSPPTKLRKTSKDRLQESICSRLNVLEVLREKVKENENVKGKENVEIVDDSPISIRDDTSPFKLTSTNTTPSPFPVHKGKKKIALSHSFSSLNDSFSPLLLHNISRYKRIAPKSDNSPVETRNPLKYTKQATRITQQKRNTNTTTPQKTRVRKRAAKYSSPDSSDQSVFSPVLDRSFKLPSNRTRSRNDKKNSTGKRARNDDSEIQDESMLVDTFDEKNITSSKSKKSIQQKTRKSVTLKSNSLKNILPFTSGINPNNSISTKHSSNQIQSFKIYVPSALKPLDKNLHNYERNLKTVYTPKPDSKNDTVKQLFIQMKELMATEHERMYSLYKDWYLETRKLITTISEAQQSENELKLELQNECKNAINEIYKTIQKQEVSVMKKRIKSFIIKI
ncbi:Synaptonemal complex protein 2 [Oopsacas minuta]|uniref:Synaptonemal complex protein 2 n=1 Tax=Oopsacas minuta TaxID=111878 RepID=A0AAV7JHU3_9METZ|nr:Synaptonemal complex protein 2 [Oopsacas minuta]